MFDEDDEWDDLAPCRDENCDVEHVHPCHVFPIRLVGSEPLIHNPSAYARPDPSGLDEAIMRAFGTQWPLAFGDVVNHVHNDYGSVSPRTIHRHLAVLVERGVLRTLDLDLAFVAYIVPSSRFLGDLDNLREYLDVRHGRHDARGGREALT